MLTANVDYQCRLRMLTTKYWLPMLTTNLDFQSSQPKSIIQWTNRVQEMLVHLKILDPINSNLQPLFLFLPNCAAQWVRVIVCLVRNYFVNPTRVEKNCNDFANSWVEDINRGKVSAEVTTSVSLSRNITRIGNGVHWALLWEEKPFRLREATKGQYSMT